MTLSIDMAALDRLSADAHAPSVLDRYWAKFGDLDTRSMLQAGAEPDAIDALAAEALRRGSALTEDEIDAACPGPRPEYGPDEMD